MSKKALGGFPKEEMKKHLGKLCNKNLIRAINITIPIDKTIIDIGAGTGRYVRALKELGYTCEGFDGSEDVWETTNHLIWFCDLTEPMFDIRQFDWGFFSEVGEHIPKKKESTIIKNINYLIKEGLIITWATPGERGYKHVNCCTPEYVESQFVKLGWWLDDKQTMKIRKIVTKKWQHKLMVLRKK